MSPREIGALIGVALVVLLAVTLFIRDRRRRRADADKLGGTRTRDVERPPSGRVP